MRRGLMAGFVLAVTAGSLPATPLVWRPAEMMKPMSLLAYVDAGYLQTARGYYWSTGTWEDLTDEQKTTLVRLLPAVFLAPAKNLELGVVAPVGSKSQGDSSSFGLGDVWLNARGGILQGPLAPVLLTLSVAAVLPTAPEDANPPLGDRTLDLGAALILQTRSLAGVTVHGRAGYWLNGSYTMTAGEVDRKVDVGDGVEWQVKVEYEASRKLGVWAALVGSTEGNLKLDGVEIPNSANDRGSVWAGVDLHPLPLLKLGLRPKFGYALEALSRGGGLAPWEAGLDAWLAVP